MSKLKKQTELFEKLREIFRNHVSWPFEVAIAKINPVLRDWANCTRFILLLEILGRKRIECFLQPDCRSTVRDP